MAKNYSNSISNATGELTSSYYERDSLSGFVQDKVHITDKLEITPAIRYSWYSSFDRTTATGEVVKGRGGSNKITPVINSQYMFDDTLSAYLGWTNIFRPMRRSDYTAVDGVFKTPLQDEKGNTWTMGVRKDIAKDTSVGANYNLTKMSNAIARLPIWDAVTEKSTNTAVNARENKKAFNVTADHVLYDSLTISASYSYTRTEWKAKEGWILDPEWGYKSESDINLMINRLTPKNRYAINISYERDKLYVGLLTNIYTGMDTLAFTSNRFLVHDWNMNYEIIKNTTAYLTISNLGNEAYETAYYPTGGMGAQAMPGRCIIVGIKQKLKK